MYLKCAPIHLMTKSIFFYSLILVTVELWKEGGLSDYQCVLDRCLVFYAEDIFRPVNSVLQLGLGFLNHITKFCA